MIVIIDPEVTRLLASAIGGLAFGIVACLLRNRMRRRIRHAPEQ